MDNGGGELQNIGKVGSIFRAQFYKIKNLPMRINNERLALASCPLVQKTS